MKKFQDMEPSEKEELYMTQFDEFKNKTFVDGNNNIYLLNEEGEWEVSAYDEALNFLNVIVVPWEIVKAALQNGFIKEVIEES